MNRIVRWIAPDLDTPPRTEPLPSELPPIVDEPAEPLPALPTLEQVQAIQTAAHRDGFERGHAEGLSQGQAEVRRLSAQIEGILDNLSQPLARLEDEVVAALGELAVRIAGTLLGRAYSADPALLSELVSEAIEAVAGGGRDVEVRLHPDDIEALTPLLSPLSGVRLTSDLALSRGDLRVHAETVRIDATLQARLQSALTDVLRKSGASQ